MISSKLIKEKAKKEGKKIGEKAIKKIETMLKEITTQEIKKAARQSDFSGRQTIKQEDILLKSTNP